jgi:hypothetical protein
MKTNLLAFLTALALPGYLPAQSGISVQIGNKDTKGSPALYSRFTIVAVTGEGNDFEHVLDDEAYALVPCPADKVAKLKWSYQGPAASLVLFPAEEQSPGTPHTNFNLIKPENLKVKTADKIQESMTDDPLITWQKIVPQKIKFMEAILKQTKEVPAINTDLSPTPLRRFFISLLRDCCDSKGWQNAWDSRRAGPSVLDAYFNCAHEYGLLLVKYTAPCCDDLTKRCLAHGADIWFKSHVRKRSDAWRDKQVKDASSLPGWDADGGFTEELLKLHGHLQSHYTATASAPQGLKSLMSQRIGNYLPVWDPKKQAGLQNLKVLLESDGEDVSDKLGEMKLSEWEDILDALKLLYNA